MKKLSMLLVLCAAILPLGAIETYSANQVANVSGPHGFSVAQGETLTVESIQEKAGASGEVTVSQAALNAINATGSAGTIINLPIAVNGGNYNIVVAKAGSNVATNNTTAIYAANIVAGANFDINNAITLASVKAYDLMSGYTLTNQVSVVDNGNSITFSVNGLSKQITVSNRAGSKETPAGDANGQIDPNQPGQQDTPQDTPQGETPQQPEGVTLDANDIVTNPDIAKTIKAESDLIQMMGAKGNDVDGTPLNITASTPDFAAIQAGTEGDYIITFTAQTAKGETVTTLATLTIKPFKLEEQQGQVAFINANNKLLTTTGTTTKVKTVDDLKTVMEVKATVSDKDALAQVKVIAANEAELLKGTPGTYDVTFEIKGKDQFNSAKTTVVLTIVSDDTPITPDGKGYISATNFLITTEEAKGITSTKDYLTIHSAQGTYNGQQVLIDVEVAENPKVVAGYQGIYDVNFKLDGDKDTNTTEDQVSVTKKLTVVMDTQGSNDGQPGWVTTPVSASEAWGPSHMGTFFNYSKYSREERIQGRFVIAIAPNGTLMYNTIKYSVEEFLNLSYEQYLARNARVVVGENGQYITNFDLKSSNNNEQAFVGPDGATDQQLETGLNGGYGYGLDAKSFAKMQAFVKEKYDNDIANQACGAVNNPFYNIDFGGQTVNTIQLMVNGENWLANVANTHYNIPGSLIVGAEIYNANCPVNGVETDDSLTPPTSDMIGQLTTPTNVPATISGNNETIVMHSGLGDTSVGNLSALTNTKVLDQNQVVAPEAVTLNPTTVPEYGQVEATFTYKDLTFKSVLYVYPDNAIINKDQTGYVAGESAMITQGELFAIKDANSFFNLIKASSATNTKDFANPTVTCANIADLKAGKVGAYTLTLENADKSAKTEIVFTVRPNKSIPTPDNKGYVDAVGSFVTEEQALQITNPNFLGGINNASAIYNGATIAPTVEIAPESLAAIQAGTKGVYQVTYTIDMNGQKASKQVNLAVAPKGSMMTGDGLGFIYAQDTTIYSSQAQALTDANELVPIMGAFAFYGENEQAPIVVKTDLAAIQASRGGQYQVTFLLDGGNNPLTREGGLQPNQAEISVVLTVVDDITDPKPVAPTPVVAQPAPQIPTGVKNAAIGLGLVVAIAAVGLVLIKRNRK